MDVNNVSPLKLKLMTSLDPAYFFWVMKVFQVGFRVVNAISDGVFGYSLFDGTRTEREMAKDYSLSAHVVKIVGRGAYSVVYNHTPRNNFLYLHEKYVHPDEILRNDNITLQGVTSTHAFFCVTDTDTNVYQTDLAPFCFMIQYLAAKKMVILPLSSFHRLAADLGHPDDRKVALLMMTARCGSTLLSQMMARVPNTRVISEPFAFVHAHGLYMTGKFSLAEYRRLLQSLVRLQCKPENDAQIDHLMIKMNNFASAQFPILKQLFPEIKQMFITRQIRPSVKSFLKINRWLPKIFRVLDEARWFTYKHMSFHYDDNTWWDLYRRVDDRGKPFTFFLKEHQINTFMYAGVIDQYLKTKGDFHRAFLFADLVRDPEGEVKHAFDALGISYEHIPAAVKALGTDSQKGIFGAMGTAKVEVTDEKWREVDATMAMCNVDYDSTRDADHLRNLIY